MIIDELKRIKQYLIFLWFKRLLGLKAVSIPTYCFYFFGHSVMPIFVAAIKQTPK